ncbi:OLC1v1004002C1 [Oldenlandia corymbosa var. corymbosa]|uniref:OLC1v1004002C1 n=1 Tax=Oldenlandia corymbosa var. corymbosa TaxID=529605 RepID=A0AAV1DBX8_OLDCO|nr:OLC1v1004002C1 [Oldenlandia corymbosa var. corymbosa]
MTAVHRRRTSSCENSSSKFFHELVLFASSAALSWLLLRTRLRILDPNLDGTVKTNPPPPEHILEDRISELPDEILSLILSFLTLKEAGRTSILSKRWKHVWKYVPDLDFNAFTTLCEMVTGEDYLDRIIRERPKFVNWVNKVLQSHQIPILNKFRIYCDLHDSFHSELNKWLVHAFDKRVQQLEINLSHHGPIYNLSTHGRHWDTIRIHESYVFNPTIFAQRSWNSLKELILKRVLVSGVTVEFLLHNCNNLESLGVHASGHLRSLKVCGPSIALQHLEINFCPLNTVIISDVNLISLKIGRHRALVLKNVPKLVHIGILSCSYVVKDFVCQFSCYFSKLVVLFLCLDPNQAREFDVKLPQLPALKQLSLKFLLLFKESMLGLTSFFRASPNLEKFVIKPGYSSAVRTNREPENVVYYPVQHLRVVEIIGYRGRSIELDLVKYFLESAVSLKKIIVDPCFKEVEHCGENWSCDLETLTVEAEVTNAARRWAKQQLVGLVPSHITLQIL